MLQFHQWTDMPMDKKPTYRAPALDKGLDILEILARTAVPMTMSEISEEAGRSRGEIFRMLQVLEERRYIARNNGGEGYALTNKLFLLGMERPPVKGVVETALPAMHRLSDEILQPCHLVVASRDQIVVIARVDAPSDLGFVVRIGHRRPLAGSTSGLVLLAFQADDMRERWLDFVDGGGHAYDRASLLKRAAQVRAKGYAQIPSDIVPGVVDLSAPILQQGTAIATITVPFLKRKRLQISRAEALSKLRTIAAEVSSALSLSGLAADPPPAGARARAR
jgi:DNA-binding IclR family transcriptional regulator